ncbi:MAG: hypothetical protein ACOYVG_14570 [Bacteroidota bacterium]
MLHHNKRSYHPYILLAFHLQLLPPQVFLQLPRSTKQYSKSKNQADLFGFELCSQQEDIIHTLSLVTRNKQLLTFNKALLHILAIKKYVQTYLFAIRQKRPSIIQTLVHNIQKVTGVIGLTKALKFTGLSYARWLKFSQWNSCSKSHLHLCRRKHPAQLLHKEIKIHINSVAVSQSSVKCSHWQHGTSILFQISRWYLVFIKWRHYILQ